MLKRKMELDIDKLDSTGTLDSTGKLSELQRVEADVEVQTATSPPRRKRSDWQASTPASGIGAWSDGSPAPWERRIRTYHDVVDEEEAIGER